MCWKALLGGLFRSPPSTTWPTDCSRLADGRRVQLVQSGISIQAFHKIRIQVLATHRPPHSQDTEASIRFEISLTGRMIGQVALLHTNHSVGCCSLGLVAVAAVGRLALGPGHRLLVVSLPSLVLTTRPPKAPRRAVPQTEAVQVQVSRQLRQLRPLLLLLLCRPSRRRETQALYFDKNCGLFG